VSRVLLAGESWTTISTHIKGFDSFTTSTYSEGCTSFLAALRDVGHEVTYLPNHVAADQFPRVLEQLNDYDLVVLSYIGANTLALPSQTFLQGRPHPNRLALLSEWVRHGGGLLMVGGYLSFQGIEAKANYANTCLAEVLPVKMESGDDREEVPEGIQPVVVNAAHPVAAGLPAVWPALLGFQRVKPKPGAEVVAAVGTYPLLVAGRADKGRVIAFTSDMGPHWLPDSFVSWDGYARLWQQCTSFLCDEHSRPQTSTQPGKEDRNLIRSATKKGV
jgi:uncharacterized membrane protein